MRIMLGNFVRTSYCSGDQHHQYNGVVRIKQYDCTHAYILHTSPNINGTAAIHFPTPWFKAKLY